MNNRWRIAVSFVIVAIFAAVAWAQQRPAEIQVIAKSHFDADTLTKALPNGGLIMVGQTRGSVASTNQGGEDAYAAYINSSGQRVWEFQFGSSLDDGFNEFQVYPNGDVLLSGYTDGTLFGNTLSGTVPIAVRVSSSGNVIWTKSYPFTNGSSSEILECNSDGALVECVYGTGSSAHHLIVLLDNQGNIAWQTEVSWSDNGHQYIGRHGTHYRFADTIQDVANDCTSVKLRCFDGSTEQNDTITVMNFNPAEEACSIDGNAVIGYSRGSRDTGEQQISLYNINTGVKTVLMSNVDSEHWYTPELIDVNGGTYKFIVYRKGTEFGEYSLDPNSNTSDSSASVYEYAGGTTTKLFDLYTAPVTNPMLASFTKRADGTYIFSICWSSGGYAGELNLGTVIGIYGASGVKIGEYSVLPSADIAVVDKNGSVIAGTMAAVPEYNAASSYYASLSTVAAPTFSLAPGTYTGTQSVSISCATTGAVIRYTTDGSEPTEASTQYTAPLSVSINTTVKARAFKTATLPSLRSDAAYKLRRATASKQSK